MNALSDIFGRVTATLQSQFAVLTTFMIRIQNMGTQIAQRVQQKIQKFLQTVTKNPESKEDYWKFFGIYFSKKMTIITSLVFLFIGYAAVYWVYPWADGKLWAANIRVDSSKITTFDGRARIYDTQGIKVYEGTLSKGKASGSGTQYDSDGHLIYSGNFQNGKYSGGGKLYDKDGTLIYDGNFSNNLYEGEGKLYSSIGRVIYVGNFTAGVKAGIGIEYDPDTQLKTYYGDHANDVRAGNGVEYEKDGSTIKYEGAFKDGVYSGSGKLYSNKSLLYSGEFSNGNYEGTGNLYNVDTGTIIYSGEFKNGLYDGSGQLYDVNSSLIVYDGAFSKGKRQGTGKSYDSLGSQQFSGNFRGDSIDYIAYLGNGTEKVTTEFGKESYRTEKDNHLILTYLNLDASVVFKVDPDKGEYVCEKIILGTKEAFMGLTAKSSAVERRSVMCEPFTSINYNCPNYYRTVFSNLAININNVNSVPSDKYIKDKYFVRFYFNEGRTELKCVEISMM